VTFAQLWGPRRFGLFDVRDDVRDVEHAIRESWGRSQLSSGRAYMGRMKPPTRSRDANWRLA
jgi:hypothetical protein